MGMDFIKRPLWTGKLSDDKLRKYLGELNDRELKGNTNSELLLDTAEAFYFSKSIEKNLESLAVDIYKEAAFRWNEREDA